MRHNHYRLIPILAGLLILLAGPALAQDFEQAMNYFKGGKFVEAAAEFQALVDQSPGYADGYHMLGLSFMQMNKANEAVQNFQKAIELSGDRFEFHHGLANAYYQSGDYGKAVATLKTAEPLAGDARTKFALYNLRGLSYVGLEKWDDAINDLEKAKAVKKTPSILDRLGLAYYSLGHHDKAVPVLREALASQPGNKGILLRLTNGLLDLGAEARDDASKSRYYSEALDAAEKYQKADPASYEAHNLVGRAALGAKEFNKAEQAFGRVIEMKPDYCYAMANLGKVYIAREKWSQAEEVLTKGAKCAPRMVVMHESLGFAVQKQGRLEEAVGHYNTAMKIKPSPSTQQLIDTCQHNIQIAQENQAMDEAERKQKEAEEAAKQEYEEAKAKAEEWKKRRERDD